MREALERAKQELGADAVVVSKARRAGGGVVLAVAAGVPRNAGDLRDLRHSATSVLQRSGALAGPGTADVERALQISGSSSEMIERVCTRVAARLGEGRHPIDLAAEEIGSLFSLAQGGSLNKLRIFGFVGPSGVGKTTSIVKLAARLARAGRRAALATLDGRRIGAVDGLRTWAKRLDQPLFLLENAGQLAALKTELAGNEALLIDSTGDVAREAREFAKLAKTAAQPESGFAMDTYLVVAASSSRSAVNEAHSQAAIARPSGVVVTKLDEARRVAPVLEHVLRLKTPVAFLCDGPEIATCFHRPTREHFADLFLRGSLR